MKTTVSYSYVAWLIVLISLLSGNKSIAQNDVFIQFVSNSVDLPTLNERAVRSSNQFILSTTLLKVDPTALYALQLKIKGNGIEIITDNSFIDNLDFKGQKQMTYFSRTLSKYFDVNHLNFSGISKEEYLLRGLPEGAYTVCFELFDVRSDRLDKVSNAACQTMFVRRLLPPEIIIPASGDMVDLSDQVLIQWRPNHISSVNSTYEINIFESVDDVSPEELRLFYLPVLRDKIAGNQYWIDERLSRLKSGRNYTVFIRVAPAFKEQSFENNGYSDPVYFSTKNSSPIETKRAQSTFPCAFAEEDIFINEIGIGDSKGNYGFVEFVVAGQSTGANGKVNLEGYVVDDNNTYDPNVAFSTGHIKLVGGTKCFGEIPRGSVILIYDDANVPKGITTRNDGMPNRDGIYQLGINSSCIQHYAVCPSKNSGSYNCLNSVKAIRWNEIFNFNRLFDLVQIRNSNGELVHAISWGDGNYEHSGSTKLIRKSEIATPTEDRFNFFLEGGFDWMQSSAFTMKGHKIGSEIATPGKLNNVLNEELVETLRTGSHKGFYITCEQVYRNGSLGVLIRFNYPSKATTIRVSVDGKTPYMATGNELFIGHLTEGIHTIRAEDMTTNCKSFCQIDIEYICKAGTPCDDQDDCTINDVLTVDCECIGEPKDEIELSYTPYYYHSCDGCVDLVPESHDPNYSSYEIEKISISTYNMGWVELDASNNINVKGDYDFHFPYFVDDYSSPDQFTLAEDLNAWFENQGYDGSFSIGTGCNSRGALNMKSLSIYPNGLVFHATSNVNAQDKFTFRSININCNEPKEEIIGYLLYPSQNYSYLYCGSYNYSDFTYTWSSGIELPTEIGSMIFIESLEACYELTLECNEGCTYTVTGPGSHCECVIGTPCIPVGEVDPCLAYFYDESCNCVGESQNLPDVDGDGVCDEFDLCQGFDDNIDNDEDGVPDGCDLCHCYDDNLLTKTEILLFLDNDPNNDPDICGYCPCDDEIYISEEVQVFEDCDYCLAYDPDNYDGDLLPFIKSFSTLDEEGEVTIRTLVNDYSLHSSDDFEQGLGDWTLWTISGPNGQQWAEHLENTPEAPSGNGCVLMRYRGGRAAMYSPWQDFSTACRVKVEFEFKTLDFEVNDKFFIEMQNQGSGMVTLKTLTINQDFVNDQSKFVSVEYDGPFSNTTRFRIRSHGNNIEDYLYMDDVAIYRMDSPTGNCITADQVEKLVSIFDEMEFGDVSFLEGETSDGPCGAGDFIYIKDSKTALANVIIEGGGLTAELTFTSPDCEDQLPGEETYLYTANADCPNPTYEWSNGETTQTIEVPAVGVGYYVTVTCGDGCEYVREFGAKYCYFGDPCLTEDPCFPNGIYDAYCECIVDSTSFEDWDEDGVPNGCDVCAWMDDTIDEDGDGVPDCLCHCDEPPLFDTIVQTTDIPYCDICFPLVVDGNQTLNEVIFKSPRGTVNLSSLSFFDFPYCAVLDGNASCSSNHDPLSQFRRDFINWTVSRNWQGVQMLYQDDQASPCGQNMDHSYFIQNLPVDAQFYPQFSNGSFISQTIDCEVIGTTTSIELNIDLGDCVSCADGPVSYQWSDPSIPSTQNYVIVPNLIGGYSVTITCGNCEYIIIHEGHCLVGTPCDDGDPCTSGDHWDENCGCVGDVLSEDDEDGDGVADYCDICPGFNDVIDDDGDGVPNGCDECMGFDDALLHDEDPSNDPEDCVECEFVSETFEHMHVIGANKPIIYAVLFRLPSGQMITAPFADYPQFFSSELYCLLTDQSACDPGLPGHEVLAFELSEFFNAYFPGTDHVVIQEGNYYYIHYPHHSNQDPWFDFGLKVKNGSSLYPQPKTIVTDVGGPCDDNNPCTENDVWDENCRCRGEIVDSDGDNVPDCDDVCPGENDFWDENGNDIPDCAEDVLFPCNGELVPFCEFYTELLGNIYPNGNGSIVRQDQLGSVPNPKMIQKNLIEVSEFLAAYMEELGGLPLNMNYPTLINQLMNLSNDANGIPDFIDPFNNANNNGFYTAAQFNTFCLSASQEQVSLLIRFTLETVNFITVAGQLGDCYADEVDQAPAHNIYPGCADALGITVYEDDNCILRIQGSNCPVEFSVDCKGNCQIDTLFFTFDPVPNDCSGDPVIGEECGLTIADCGNGDCAVWEVVGNPDYHPTDNPNVAPCLCVERSDGDADGDGVCDDLDQCEDEDDDDGNPAQSPDFPAYDNDGDGIHDCHDECPEFPGSIGDACDDGVDVTFGDHINGDCECQGFYVDTDGDGIPDGTDCESVADFDGDGYMDYLFDDISIVYDDVTGQIIGLVNEPDGLPDCDVCPGLDDKIDADGDGIPDCVNPPFNELGCPISFELVPGEGVVVVFDSEEITIDEIPQPITVLFQEINQQGPATIHEYDYLLYSNVREAEGQYEVFYPIDNFSEFILEENLGVVSVAYSEFQQCVMLSQTPEYVQLGCPDNLEYYTTNDNLVLTFNIPTGSTLDPDAEEGEVIFNMTSDNGADLIATFPYTADDFEIDANGNASITLVINPIGPVSGYSGTIELSSSMTPCSFEGGELQEDCLDEVGEPIAAGEPCDDNDPCTENDQWVDIDGTCECQGTPKPDSDGDGVCDDEDQEVSDLMCPTQLNAGNTSGSVELWFDVDPGFNIDPNALNGQITFTPISGSPATATFSIADVNYNPDLVIISLSNLGGLGNITAFSGSITLPNGLTCDYTSGSSDNACQFDDNGVLINVEKGAPCDDGDPCTHHDKYSDSDGDGNCDCVGEQSPDSDEDGVCDEMDQCDGESDYDGDFNGIPDACECLPPTIASIEAIGFDAIKVTLTDLDNDKPVTLSIANSGYASEVVEITSDSYVFYNLTAGLTYTVQAQYECSELATMSLEVPTTQESAEFCGSSLPVDYSSVTPLMVLAPGDVIHGADFEVIVDRSSGTNGLFTGGGHIQVPYFGLVEIKVTFYNIRVSDSYQLIEGEIVVTGLGTGIIPDDVLNFLQDVVDGLTVLSDFLGDIIDALDKIKSIVESVENLDGYLDIKDILTNYSEIINGNPFIPDAIKLELQNAMACFDNLPDPTDPGHEAAFQNCMTLLNTALANLEAALLDLYNSSAQIPFDKAGTQKYGYDKKTTVNDKGYPATITVATVEYDIPWKAVVVGQEDFILATNTDDVAFADSDITFEDDDLNTPPFASTSVSGGLLVTIPSSLTSSMEPGEVKAIYAVERKTIGQEVVTKLAGKFNVIAYAPKTYNIKIIEGETDALNGFSAGVVQTQMNDVYAQAGISINVEFETGIMPALPIDGALDQVPSGLSEYNDEMKDIISSYKSNIELQESTFYLFVVNSAEQGSLRGYMPKGKGFGFIIKSQHADDAALARTVSHELSHGAFILDHFPDDNPSGNTQNLLDNSDGTELFKFQWDQIHTPRSYFGLFDENSSSESNATISGLDRVKNKLVNVFGAEPDLVGTCAVCWQCEPYADGPTGQPVVFTTIINNKSYACSFARKTTGNGLSYNSVDQSNSISSMIGMDGGIYGDAFIHDFTSLPTPTPEIFMANFTVLSVNPESAKFSLCENLTVAEYEPNFCAYISAETDFMTDVLNTLSGCPGQSLDDLLGKAMEGSVQATYNNALLDNQLTEFQSLAELTGFDGVAYVYDHNQEVFHAVTKDGHYNLGPEETERIIADLSNNKFPGYNNTGSNAEDAAVLLLGELLANGEMRIKYKINPDKLEINAQYGAISSTLTADLMDDVGKSKLESIKSEQSQFHGDFFIKDKAPLDPLDNVIDANDGEFNVKEASWLKYGLFFSTEVKTLVKDAKIGTSLWNPANNAEYTSKIINVYSPIAGAVDAPLEDIADLKELFPMVKQFVNEPRETTNSIIDGLAGLEPKDIIKMIAGDFGEALEPGVEGNYAKGKVVTKSSISIIKLVVGGGAGLATFAAIWKKLGKGDTDISKKVRETHEKFDPTAPNEPPNGPPSVPSFSDKFKEMPLDLQKKFTDDFGDLVDDIETQDLFKNKPKALDSWKKLADRPKWVKTNNELLEKLADNPGLLDDVEEYYRVIMPKNTPSGFNGAGTYSGVEFNKFGHPELTPHVSSPDHIVPINVVGNHSTDFTAAKNALRDGPLGGDATRLRKTNTNGQWSPFEIKNEAGVWEGPYTWHHHQDGSNMMPVKKEIHDAIKGKHTGGAKIKKDYPELAGFFNQP